MSVVEEPNGKPQIFSKWGHKEFLVHLGDLFLFTKSNLSILASSFLCFGRERTPGNLLAIVAVVVAASSFPSVPFFSTDY